MITREKEQIIRQLQNGGKTFWELLRAQGTHLSTFIRYLKTLVEENTIVFDPHTKQFRLLEPSKPFATPMTSYCPQCSGRGLALHGSFSKALQDFQEITADRPLPIARYDQGTIDPSDLALKAQLMHHRGDLENRAILLLGDDDLFSIFLALLGLSRHLMVLDIDTRLLHYISNKIASYRLNIELKPYDVKDTPPREIEKSFEVFVSEPPESIRGLRLFLERGISCLEGEGGTGYIGLTTLESSWSKWLEIQKFLLSKKMVITDILRDFSWYPERATYWDEFYKGYHMLKEIPYQIGTPDTDWYRSTLLRIEMTREIDFAGEDLYMDEETWATPQPYSEFNSSQ